MGEKQFANMKLLNGTKNYQEKKINADQMLLF
jgi:CRISPR/Cas system-associated protein endoribonuclease Cas2